MKVTVYSPQTNDGVERVNRTFVRLLPKYSAPAARANIMRKELSRVLIGWIHLELVTLLLLGKSIRLLVLTGSCS